MLKSLCRKTSFYAAVAILGVLLDQASKYAVIRSLMNKEDIILIKGVLSLTYAENQGAAFGILPGGRLLFTCFAVLVTAGAFVYIRRILKSGGPSIMCLWLSLISAGAIGNMIDRIARGSVIDFIYFSVIDFPVFNIADIFIVFSCFMLVISLFAVKDDDSKAGGVR